MTNILFWKAKKGIRTPIDFLVLWICCTVWPGMLVFLVITEAHKLPLALAFMVLAGLITSIYLWTYDNQN
jgi:hypothetical protein